MRQKSANRDVAIAAQASLQHGVVSIRQLAAAGLDAAAVRRRVQAGRLHRVHRGVYAVGHRGLGDSGQWMAAVLACGRGAALSHSSAAALWGLLPSAGGAVDVSVQGAAGRRLRPGIRLHRSITLSAGQITRRMGIPVTSPPRTISDLRRVMPKKVVRRVVRQAGVAGFALPEGFEPDLTRSELERSFLRLCRGHRLPPPEVNVRVGRFLVDFLWRGPRVIAETDGFRYHRGREAFENDRARDLELRAQGFAVVRVTYRQLTESPDGVASALRSVIEG